jgi:hypothetical protein
MSPLGKFILSCCNPSVQMDLRNLRTRILMKVHGFNLHQVRLGCIFLGIGLIGGS